MEVDDCRLGEDWMQVIQIMISTEAFVKGFSADGNRISIDNLREVCIISPILCIFVQLLDEFPTITKSKKLLLFYKSRRFVHVLVYSGLFPYGYHD
jgi:hypothetical protein